MNDSPSRDPIDYEGVPFRAPWWMLVGAAVSLAISVAGVVTLAQWVSWAVSWAWAAVIA